MAPHSSTLAWKIPWTEEPGGLQSMGSIRVGHDWVASLSLFTFRHWRRKWQPTPVFLPGESQGRGSLWAAVYGVAQSRTRLRRLSSSNICKSINVIHIKKKNDKNCNVHISRHRKHAYGYLRGHGGVGRGESGIWGQHAHTAVGTPGDTRSCSVVRKLYSVSCDNL